MASKITRVITARVPNAIADELEERAKSDGKTLSAYIAWLLSVVPLDGGDKECRV
jgi:hypothetical protein